jgi:hypothetical protein
MAWRSFGVIGVILEDVKACEAQAKPSKAYLQRLKPTLLEFETSPYFAHGQTMAN